MSIDHILAGLYVFSLAAFLGYQIISKVPQLLHTPLMAFTNAISGVSVVASILIAGRKSDTVVIPILGAIAVASATINVVGGFVITDRMLKMFKREPAAAKTDPKAAPPAAK
jgi:NAD(P) transhydrogenase subunit alpha